MDPTADLNAWENVIPAGNQIMVHSGVPRNFVQGRVQQIQLRTEDIEKGDLGAVGP